ncbi:cell division protein ZapA [Peribacillus deserti]|uniref:Cell division protein ZapA n=1 Tax=Peribacillus deserti TaxID=673318 RepID=A0ABS2QGB1_9BACI|nr:cell division protein ZapA [Peribacillus deserti]MBM7692005.1 cell division protein ZapA [Peribacillus deserti]
MSDHSKRKITVDIYGQQYTIVGAESSSHIRIVASMVDDKMREINSKNPRLDVSKVAVLTAVNVMHDYLKVKDELEQLKMLIRSEKG